MCRVMVRDGTVHWRRVDNATRTSGHRLPAATALGGVHLQVSDLDRSVRYYTTTLGLRLASAAHSVARLTAADERTDLVTLHERPGAQRVPQSGRLGLFHVALLLPSRGDLGRFVRHLAASGVHFGSADHAVSEALYLWDPDGLGLEVYADRPRDAWRVRGGELLMTTESLDFASLVTVAGAQAWAGMPAGTMVGHVHLSVDDLDAARRFYQAGLGLDITLSSYPGALFMAAGGYHHHLGTNTWARRARPAGEEDARLIEWSIRLPTAGDVSAAAASLRAAGADPASEAADVTVIDPWGVQLRLVAASMPTAASSA